MWRSSQRPVLVVLGVLVACSARSCPCRIVTGSICHVRWPPRIAPPCTLGYASPGIQGPIAGPGNPSLTLASYPSLKGRLFGVRVLLLRYCQIVRFVG